MSHQPSHSRRRRVQSALLTISPPHRFVLPRHSLTDHCNKFSPTPYFILTNMSATNISSQMIAALPDTCNTSATHGASTTCDDLPASARRASIQDLQMRTFSPSSIRDGGTVNSGRKGSSIVNGDASEVPLRSPGRARHTPRRARSLESKGLTATNNATRAGDSNDIRRRSDPLGSGSVTSRQAVHNAPEDDIMSR